MQRPCHWLAGILATLGAYGDMQARFSGREDDQRALSFVELRRRALRLLGALQRRGLRPGDALILFVNDIEPRWIARRSARQLQDRVIETVLEHLAAMHTAGHGAPGPRLHGGP